MERKLSRSVSNGASIKASSVVSFAHSRKSRGSVLESANTSRVGMSMKDVLLWKKITKRWHNRVLERQRSRTSGFSWWEKDTDKTPKKEPTYRLEPQETPKVHELIKIIQNYVEERFSRKVSIWKTTGLPKQQTMQISDEVKQVLKTSKHWPKRYKCIVYVTMGQKNRQGMRVSSRCAWDEKFDRTISYTYQNENIFCVITAFAVYCE